MRFNGEGRSGDVQDRRGVATAGGLGIGGIVVVGIIALIMGRSPTEVIGGMARQASQNRTTTGAAGPRNPQEAQAEQLVRRATTSIQDFWNTALPMQAQGRAYQRTQLVLFSDAIRSGCGSADAQTGPFYCPADQLVYVDLSFFSELDQRFAAPGDFAQAYVIAHEFGHHVQHILQIDQRTRAMQQANRAMENTLNVALELQADCFAGAWGNYAAQQRMLDPGDVEEGLAAAASIGDDRIQRMAGRSVSPERFTHGSSAQRVQWFRAGMNSGDLRSCTTFNGSLSP